jgi:hypothetical protein
MMGTLILVVLVVFLAAALGLACLEQAGGYIGDSSLVPGCLGVMVLVIAAIVVVGLCIGRIGFWIN